MFQGQNEHRRPLREWVSQKRALQKAWKEEASRTVVFQDWQNMERDLLSSSHGLGQHQRVRDSS